MPLLERTTATLTRILQHPCLPPASWHLDIKKKKKKKKSQYCVDKSRNVNLWQTYSWVFIFERILDSNNDPRWSATFLFKKVNSINLLINLLINLKACVCVCVCGEQHKG